MTRAFGAWNLELINGIVAVTNDFGYFAAVGNVSRVNGYVTGYMQRTFDSIGTAKFEVGTENGYSPVTVDVTAGNDFPAAMIVRAVQTAQPNIQDPSRALSRYWQVYGGPNITSANLTFNYLDPIDVPRRANESNFVIQRYRNGFTQPAGVVDTQANTFRVTGVSDFSFTDWTLAEPSAVNGTPTPTATNTATPTATATSTPNDPAISGTITYGNAIGAPTPRFVSGVLLTGVGSPNVSATSHTDGTYSLSGFGNGSYTVTPSKTGGVNGAITSFDSARIAQHAAGINPLTGNQLIVADVSGNGTISSFDAAQIARYAAGLNNSGSTGNWIFMPANRFYPSVTANIAGEDFIALLMGDVSGNWMDSASQNHLR